MAKEKPSKKPKADSKGAAKSSNNTKANKENLVLKKQNDQIVAEE